MADIEEPVSNVEMTSSVQSEADVVSDKDLEGNDDHAKTSEDETEVNETDPSPKNVVEGETKISDAFLTSEDNNMTVDETSKHDEEKEEVFDFSSEHPFEDNDETIEEADEEKAQDDDKDGVEMGKDVEEDDDEEEEEEVEDPHPSNSDPNVMPQVNVTVLAQRKWQVKVYPLKPADFVSGQISRVFKNARESLLYLLSPGRNARGKGEMYISSPSQAMRAVFSLMRLTYFYPEINVEIIKKSDEGSVEEKAYIRFDSKMTNLLTIGSFRTGPGRKRERLIGSVFVKNLPPGTTKDVLRVMFPFAQEINYNPEKFKDCTARLVLKSRNHVIPCLKAFAKVELGGNVLELHPLEKKKRVRTKEEDEDAPEAKHRKKSEEGKKEETSKKEEEPSKPEVKTPDNKKDSGKPEKKDPKVTPSQKTPVKRGQQAAKHNNGKKERYDQAKPFRPKLVGGQERSSRGSGIRRGGGRNDWSTDRGDRNKLRQDKLAVPNRNFRDNDRNKGFRNQAGSARNFGRSPRGFGAARRSGGSQVERMNITLANQGIGTSIAPSSASLAINADATKEMVLLQNQLSVAIKNQLAMLNHTQLAVEQAKRGAPSLGLSSSDLQQTSRQSAKAFGGSSGGSGYGKRSIDQYRRGQGDGGMEKQYGSRNRSRDRGMRSSRGTQGGGYGKRGGSFRDQREESYYDRAGDMDLGHSQGLDGYGRSSRDFSFDSSNSFGSPGRSTYGQDSGGYSGYHY